MWCGTHTGLGWAGWTLMTLGMIAFWGAIVWAVIAVLRARNAYRQPPSARPGEILSGRLARGEITEEEYVRARDLLEDSGAPTSSNEPTEVT
jgi:putative membrane protein